MIVQIKKIFSSEFVKNNLQLISGTIITQLINLVFNIILTRLYLPESWGKLSFFLISCSVFLVISSFKLDINLVTAKDDGEIKKLLHYSFTFTFFIALLAFLFFSSLNIFSETTVKALEWWWIIGYLVCIYLLSSRQILWMLALKYKLFKLQSFTLIGEALLVNIISMILYKFGDIGLLIGNIISQIFAVTWLLKNIFKDYQINFNVLKPEILPWRLLKRILIIQRHNIFQGYIDLFQIYAFTIIFSSQMEIIGYYFLCIRVLQLPLRLFFGPISNIFLRTLFDKKIANATMSSLYIKVLIGCFLIYVPILLTILLFGKELFRFIFGETWIEAGRYAQILIFWIGLDVIKIPMSQVFYLFNRQKVLNFLSFLSIILSMIFMVFGRYYFEIKVILYGMSIIGSLFSLIIIYYSYLLVKEFDEKKLLV